MEARFFRFGIPAAVLALCGIAAAQSSQPKLQLVSANAQLTQNVDSKNVSEGQTVTAKLTSDVRDAGAVELPKGTTLIGKVEHVQKASGNTPTELSIVFDQAKLRDGKTVEIKATLLSAYSADEGQYFVQTGDNGSMAPQQPHIIAADATTDQEPGLLGGVSLHSQVASDASGVFTSNGHNIDLKRGTQLQFAIAPTGSQAQGVVSGQ
jgi:hypothetical protein